MPLEVIYSHAIKDSGMTNNVTISPLTRLEALASPRSFLPSGIILTIVLGSELISQ